MNAQLATSEFSTRARIMDTVRQLSNHAAKAEKAGKPGPRPVTRQQLMAVDSLRVMTWSAINSELVSLCADRELVEIKVSGQKAWRLAA